jgi:hypothetical protein
MQFWNSSNLSLPINLIDSHEDGVQSALHVLFSYPPSETILSQFLFIVWYIWKARNDLHFREGIGTIFRFVLQLKLTGTQITVPRSPCSTLYVLLLVQCLMQESTAILMPPLYQIRLP